MDFISPEQIWGLFLFFLGAGMLTWCSHLERKEDEFLRDSKNRYKQQRRKTDFVIPQTVRGAFLTITGSLISLAGITIFFLHID